MKNFTPKFPWFPNIEIFINRKKILEHIEQSFQHFSGTLLDVGSGHMPYKELILKNTGVDKYIGMDLSDSDIYNKIKPDIYWDGYTIPLEDNSIDSILLTEVLEHCPYPSKTLAEISRVVKPGGKVIFSVPFLWYLHESPYDFYRYTPYAIKMLFNDAGFSMASLETYGGTHLSFLHFYFIWLKKSSFPKVLRFVIYLLTLPFILLALAIINKKNNSDFKNGQIYIGLVGVAEKK